jgi:hypothetical protein
MQHSDLAGLLLQFNVGVESAVGAFLCLLWNALVWWCLHVSRKQQLLPDASVPEVQRSDLAR